MEIKKLDYGWGVKLAVLLIICVQYTVTITSPILGTIQATFPEHAAIIKLLETIPTFAAVIISLLLGPLMKIFYKKQLLLFGIVLSFFQFIPAVVPGFWTLFICRTIAGFGIGFMYSFAASFAVDMFTEADAATMLGLRSTLGAIMGIVYQQISARLADASGSYQRSFLVALVLVPIFLYILVFMPKSCPV
jgi:MFS family permease